MTDEAMSPSSSVLGRPNSYIGKTVPRPNVRKLVRGKGQFVDDLKLPRMVQAVFLRSPHAHAKIRSIDTSEAVTMPGVVRVVTGPELLEYCEPWVGVLTHFKGLKSAPQHAIAVNQVSWQGEAVAAVVANSRAEAEDAAAMIAVDYDEL
ncbi:MAG TPA: carbon monoxide dehydrogenase, partial [Rhodospirillaceae bacterium]|nr:carbon monoxide dehydrogenase [Rhodospirillaceae bacterium]